MATFMTELWESIFTPGPTPTLLKAANGSFAALQFVLAVMFLYTWNIHAAILSVLSGSLWWAINWFAAELAVHQAREEQKKREQEAREAQGGPPSSDSETEVEEATPAPRTTRSAAKAAAKTPVEPAESVGELRKRGGLAVEDAMTQSSVSTEDEWEKVSENEEKK